MLIRSLTRSALLVGLGFVFGMAVGRGGSPGPHSRAPFPFLGAALVDTASGDVGPADVSRPAVLPSAARDGAPRPPSVAAAAAGAPGDSGALAALATGLLVPVVGILPAALRDGFSEPRRGHVHEAIDIMAPRGTPVVAATDGRLLRLHRSRAGGLMVYASDAADRFILMYGHLDRYAPGLENGATLRRGQLLGYVGTTGNAPPGAPHLHFAIAEGKPSVRWWKGTPVNPYPLLARGASLATLPATPAPRATADAAADITSDHAAASPSRVPRGAAAAPRPGRRSTTPPRQTKARTAAKAVDGRRTPANRAGAASRGRAASKARVRRSPARRTRSRE